MIKLIDARNIPCPAPVIEAKKALKEMKQGKLEVLVDNMAAVQNLKKLAAYLELNAVSEEVDEGAYKVTFQITEGEESPAYDETETAFTEQIKKGCLVVIAADHMGSGDEALGKALMKGFLYALTELEKLPETIIFYNGGARLSTEGSESLEDLKLLNAQGVEVLTCGTCLNHYGLSEKLGVGTVTNMYAIAEKMTEASQIIRP